ncbi:hypothetical protein VitviT2T_021821 [Vitis vinifera]|uniref:Uncharacterized protein n=1 Tax=Vitis vinifera TaxID=29760 RepID=A0ABY9DAG2_VITVI|nr:hypothetical protein VitviT2T_021821 [Vitis vinifera]
MHITKVEAGAMAEAANKGLRTAAEDDRVVREVEQKGEVGVEVDNLASKEAEEEEEQRNQDVDGEAVVVGGESVVAVAVVHTDPEVVVRKEVDVYERAFFLILSVEGKRGN